MAVSEIASLRQEIVALRQEISKMHSDQILLRGEFDTVKSDVEHYGHLLVEGNGIPSIKELSRTFHEWMKENKNLPSEVATQKRWIQNANRGIWTIVFLVATLVISTLYKDFLYIPHIP